MKSKQDILKDIIKRFAQLLAEDGQYSEEANRLIAEYATAMALKESEADVELHAEAESLLEEGTTERIAELNDLARTAMGVASTVFQTHGVRQLDARLQSRIRERVETFDDFSGDNNPWGERDFGSFEEGGERIFWKIDYYDLALEKGSEHPEDPAQTKRVLTIMLASEY